MMSRAAQRDYIVVPPGERLLLKRVKGLLILKMLQLSQAEGITITQCIKSTQFLVIIIAKNNCFSALFLYCSCRLNKVAPYIINILTPKCVMLDGRSITIGGCIKSLLTLKIGNNRWSGDFCHVH